MQFIKSPYKAKDFVLMDSVMEFLLESIGETYLVGHTRYATRGDPRINENNHPVFPESMEFFVVHNGMITCKKYDLTPENTDTTILAHGIDTFFKDTTPFFDVVAEGFEDITTSGSSNDSAIIAGTENELVLARTTGRPIVIQFAEEDDLIIMGSTEDIAGLVFEESEKFTVADYSDVNDHSIVGINLKTGKLRAEFLNTMHVLVPRSKYVQKKVPLPPENKNDGEKLKIYHKEEEMLSFADLDEKDDIQCSTCEFLECDEGVYYCKIYKHEIEDFTEVCDLYDPGWDI